MAGRECGGAFRCNLGVGVGAAWNYGLVVNGGWKGGNGKRERRGVWACGLMWKWRGVQKQTIFVVSGVFIDDHFRIWVFWVGGKVVGCEKAGGACTETVPPWFWMS